MDLTRPIPNYEGRYAATRDGHIYSLAHIVIRSNGRRITIHGRERKQGVNGHGYPSIVLSKDGIKRTYEVHVLMALTFLGPRPPKYEVRHLDGNPLNRSVDNLRYGTSSQNRHDSVRHGTHSGAKKSHCKRGHLLDGVGKNKRYCLTCSREYSHAYYERNKAS